MTLHKYLMRQLQRATSRAVKQGRYKKHEFTAKVLHIYFQDIIPGPYAEGVIGVRSQPPSWANYFKIMQFFTRKCVNTPNFGLEIGIFLGFAPRFVKFLKFTPRFQNSAYVPEFFIFLFIYLFFFIFIF